MSWYSAHILMAVEYVEGEQDRFPAWENVVLLRAASEAEAWGRAEERGRQDAEDHDGFQWDGRAARWRFAGVRKMTECVPFGDRPDDGDEVSYVEFEFPSRADLEHYLNGEPATLTADRDARALMDDEPAPGANQAWSSV